MNNTSALDKAALYHDLGSLNDLKRMGKSDEKAALKAVAQQFESFFLQEIFKNMRAGNELINQDSMFDSQQVKFFQGMHDEQMAATLASKSSFGIADLVVNQLTQKVEKANPNKNLANVQRNNFSAQFAALHDKKMGLSEASIESQNRVDNTELSYSSDASQQPYPQTVSSIASMGVELTVNRVNDEGKRKSEAAANVGHANLHKKSSLTSSAETKRTDAWYEFSSPSDFIEKMMPMAKKAAQLLGVSAKVLVAQAALETGWGKHVIKNNRGDSSFNLFNIKADHRWDGSEIAKQTLEFEQGFPVKKVESFRAYQSFDESFSDYAGFVKNSSRYQQAIENADNEEKYIESLHQAGYATDPQYSDKVKRILNSELLQAMPD